MAKSRRKRTPRTVLKLPDLEHSKSAVLNSQTSASSKRSYDLAIRALGKMLCSSFRVIIFLRNFSILQLSVHTSAEPT